MGLFRKWRPVPLSLAEVEANLRQMTGIPDDWTCTWDGRGFDFAPPAGPKRIVTFKDWLDRRERPTIVTDPSVPRDTAVVFASIDPGLRTGAPISFHHFDEAPFPE